MGDNDVTVLLGFFIGLLDFSLYTKSGLLTLDVDCRILLLDLRGSEVEEICASWTILD